MMGEWENGCGVFKGKRESNWNKEVSGRQMEVFLIVFGGKSEK